MGGIGGSYILALFKYPLRFHVSCVLAFRSPLLFSTSVSLSLSRFPYLICEYMDIASWTVAAA